MHIQGISAVFPDRVVTNDDIIEMVRDQSKKTFQGDLEEALSSISYLLNYSGAKERRWLKPNEAFFPHVEKAVNQALTEARMTKEDIDTLILASVDKRLLEPSNASFFAGALGFKQINCFDISEACNGWTRASQIADAFLKSGHAKTVMVVTSEFGSHEGEICWNGYKLSKKEDLDWAFANYTVGESATATIFTFDEKKDWHYQCISKPQHADLCLIPLHNYPEAMSKLNHLDLNAQGSRIFVSYSKPLFKAVYQECLILAKNIFEHENTEDFDIVFGHSLSNKFWQDIQRDLNRDIPFYLLYSNFGNLVSGTMPCSIYLAIKENKLKRGDNVCAIMPAAGISCIAYQFTY